MAQKMYTPEEIADNYKETFKKKIKEIDIKKHATGSQKKESVFLWMKIEREIFTDVVKHLKEFDFPHFAVISGTDMGKTIELIYHFTLNYGNRLGEIVVNISVDLPKDDLTIPSICDIIPGALISEREIQEMFGITVKNIPDNRRLFLSDDFPDDVYPWRKDEKGPDNLIRDLYEVEK